MRDDARAYPLGPDGKSPQFVSGCDRPSGHHPPAPARPSPQKAWKVLGMCLVVVVDIVAAAVFLLICDLVWKFGQRMGWIS